MTRSAAPGSFLRVVAVTVALFAAGCVNTPDPKDPDAVAEFYEINDPAEPTLRVIFEFNRMLDTVILKPVAGVYKDSVPDQVREGIYNFLNNLRSPIIFINDVLQGDVNRAVQTLARFMINTTVGIFGLNDQAAALGLAYHNEDFGQTLATWGIEEGPYLVLPIFGPSNPRDAIGMLVDFFMDPFNIVVTNSGNENTIWAQKGLRGVDFRARYWDEIEDLEKSSLDYYAAVRSLYRQRRNDEIRNGKPPKRIPGPGLGMKNDAPSIDAEDEISELR